MDSACQEKFPERWLAIFVGLSVAVWTLQCSLLQRVLSADIYETIMWGQQAQWGYSKHPPLSGWVGYFCSWATGHSDWGMYLAAQLCIAVGVIFIYLLGRKLLDRPRAVLAALLAYFLFYYTPSEMKFSTYFLEMALTPAAAYALLSALRENRWRQWLALGVLGGLGLLNKYSFALTLLSFALIVLTRREYRRRLGGIGPYLAAAVMLIIFAPHVRWLIQHDWVCFRHVGDRLDEKHDLLMPLYVLAATLYPVASGLLILALANFPGFRNFGRETWRQWGGRIRQFFAPVAAAEAREALHFAGIMAAVPGAVYILLALAGQDIILMWLCPVGFWGGIVAVALAVRGNAVNLGRRVAILLGGVLVLILVITTLDLLINTRVGLHLDRDAVIQEAEALWQKARGDEPVKLVIGSCRFAVLFSHYTADHPYVCDPEDEVMIELFQDSLARNGALVICGDSRKLQPLFRRLSAPVELKPCTVAFRAPWGRTRKRRFVVGVIPPGTIVRPVAPRR